jgi:maleylacetate reductase
LPPLDTGGTALNALAHCAEALYAKGRSAETDSEALAGATQIAGWLPTVLEDGHHRQGRRNLLEGAMHAGAALRAGMGLGHAMVQALGGRLGLPHGPMNAVCLPLALRFNREAVPDALDRLGSAMRSSDPIARIEQLAVLACPPHLRDYGVPREALKDVAEATAVRPAAKANPRPASSRQILELLNDVW